MNKIEELIYRKEECYNGKDKEIYNQHNQSKLTARERIEGLFDEGSFLEFSPLMSKNGGGVITGYGTINGRLVYAYSQDYTIDGGALNLKNSRKITNIMDMAAKMGAPLVQIFDSTGAKLTEDFEALAAYGEIIKRNAKLSGVIPQIALVAGPCAGASAVSASMSDFTIAVKGYGELYINPPLNYKEYGSAEGSSSNGTAQFVANDDDEALQIIKDLLSYLPSNNIEIITMAFNENINELDNNLNELCEKDNLDVNEIISSISDNGSFININSSFAKNIITGFIKIGGSTVGLIANDKEGSRLNRQSLNKLYNFTRICNSFNIPILSVVNVSGITSDTKEESEGLSLYLAKALYALSEADVPKVSLIIGKAYGSAYLLMSSKEASFDVVYAWPSAKVCITEPEDFVKTFYKDELIEQDKPNELIEKYINEAVSPYKAAEKGLVDDIIIPAETKVRLFAAFDMLQSKRIIKYPKKHGSVLL